MTGPQKIKTVDGSTYYIREDPTKSKWVHAYDYSGHRVLIQAHNIVEYDDGFQTFDDRKMAHCKEEA